MQAIVSDFISGTGIGGSLVRVDNGTAGPDVLHVGFSKCASTFLQAFFEEHDDVFLVNQSHYIAPFDLSPYPDKLNEYRLLFSDALDDQVRLESDEHIILPLFHPVLGAAATTLDSVEEVAARIGAIQPNAKIVLVIRNQVDLIVSRYSEYVLCGGISTFAEFVVEFLSCSEDKTNYFQNYYQRITEIFDEWFSPTNVLLLLQEDLARDEDSTIQRLSEFLGVKQLKPSKRGLVARRIGLSRLGLSTMRLINRLLVRRPKQSYKEAQTRGPYIVYKSIQRAVRIIDYLLPDRLKGDKNAILSAQTRTLIQSEFAADNRKLGQALNRDLRQLGY